MQFRVFAIPAMGDQEAEASLNAFLRGNRITQVHQALIGDGTHWTYSVQFLASEAPGASQVPPAYKSSRVDYMKELPPEQFAVFARLRSHRKTVAEAESVRAYTIFTNAQLAAMVQLVSPTLQDVAAIDGVGEARMTYAPAFLALLATDDQT